MSCCVSRHQKAGDNRVEQTLSSSHFENISDYYCCHRPIPLGPSLKGILLLPSIEGGESQTFRHQYADHPGDATESALIPMHDSPQVMLNENSKT